ncbi:MAG: histidine kinase [Cyclobacteriaceae bacterium]
MQKQDATLGLKSKILLSGAFWVLFISLDLLKKAVWTREDDYILYFYIPGIVLWLLLSFPIVRFSEWTDALNKVIGIPLLLFAGAALSVLKTLITFAYQFHFSPEPVASDFTLFIQNARSFYYIESIIIAWVYIGFLTTFTIYNRYISQSKLAAELAAELSNAQLDALRMQIEPHFLFNTLNTATSLVRAKRDADALLVLTGLADLLRIILHDKKNHLVRLAEELNFIERYLDIESVRFKDRLTVVKEIDSASRDVLVPNLILQPIVENALKHGVAKFLGPGVVKLKSFVDDNFLFIEVINQNAGINKSISPGSGIGLKNVENRLEKLYAGSANFTFSRMDKNAVARIKIPLK